MPTITATVAWAEGVKCIKNVARYILKLKTMRNHVTLVEFH